MQLCSMNRSNNKNPQAEFERLLRESEQRCIQGLPDTWVEQTDPKDTRSIEIRCVACRRMNTILYHRDDRNPVPAPYRCQWQDCRAVNPAVDV